MKKMIGALVLALVGGLFIFFVTSANAAVLQLDENFLGKTIYVSQIDSLPDRQPWSADWTGEGYAHIPAYFTNDGLDTIMVNLGPSWWCRDVASDPLFFNWNTKPLHKNPYITLLPGESFELDLVTGGFRMASGTYEISSAENGDWIGIEQFGLYVSINGNPQAPLILENGNDCLFRVEVGSAPVPIPGAIWLLGSGIVGVFGLRRKK